MRLLLLLVAIYSLIFYQHYKLAKYKTLFSGVKAISATEKPYKFTVSELQNRSLNTGVITTSHFPQYKNDQLKPQMASFILPADHSRRIFPQ